MADDSAIPNSSLREARTTRHWTQGEVATRLVAIADRDDHSLRLNAKKVSDWECGRSRPNPEHRRLLCELFDASEEQLGINVSPRLTAAVTPSTVRHGVIEVNSHPAMPQTVVPRGTVLDRTRRRKLIVPMEGLVVLFAIVALVGVVMSWITSPDPEPAAQRLTLMSGCQAFSESVRWGAMAGTLCSDPPRISAWVSDRQADGHCAIILIKWYGSAGQRLTDTWTPRACPNGDSKGFDLAGPIASTSVIIALRRI